MIIAIALVAGLLPLTPAIIYAVGRRQRTPVTLTRRLAVGLGSFNIVVALMIAGLGLVWLFAPHVVEASGLAQGGSDESSRYFAAAIAVSVGSIGAAYAVSTTGSAALGAVAEKPELFGRALTVIGLAEGVAIYGLIIAFMIVAT
jgi:V/A-type H+-transporting ATPase subunit K